MPDTFEHRFLRDLLAASAAFFCDTLLRLAMDLINLAADLKAQIDKGHSIIVWLEKVTTQTRRVHAALAELAVKCIQDGFKDRRLAGSRRTGDDKQPLPFQCTEIQRRHFCIRSERRHRQSDRSHGSSFPNSAKICAITSHISSVGASSVICS